MHCQVTLGIELSGFRIISIGDCEQQEESDNDRLSGEFVPVISRDQFEHEAEKFLERYYPDSLERLRRVPIEEIAHEMGLRIVEDIPLSDELTYFGTIVFDDGNILDRHRKIDIRNAKRGTIYLDPRVKYEVGRFHGEHAALVAHQLADGVLLHEAEGVAQHVPVQRDHVIGLGVHEVVQVAVVVAVLGVLALHSGLLELGGGVEGLLADGAGHHVLVLGTHESGALAGLHVLEVHDGAGAYRPFKSDTLTEIACGNRHS